MKTAKWERRTGAGVHTLGMWLVLAFAAPGCDKFFDVRGVLVECGTTQGIPEAQGVAAAAGHSGKTQFTTDAAGAFVIHMNAPEDAQVTVTIVKPGFADLSVEYDGLPASSDHVQLCMDRD